MHTHTRVRCIQLYNYIYIIYYKLDDAIGDRAAPGYRTRVQLTSCMKSVVRCVKCGRDNRTKFILETQRCILQVA